MNCHWPGKKCREKADTGFVYAMIILFNSCRYSSVVIQNVQKGNLINVS